MNLRTRTERGGPKGSSGIAGADCLCGSYHEIWAWGHLALGKEPNFKGHRAQPLESLRKAASFVHLRSLPMPRTGMRRACGHLVPRKRACRSAHTAARGGRGNASWMRAQPGPAGAPMHRVRTVPAQTPIARGREIGSRIRRTTGGGGAVPGRPNTPFRGFPKWEQPPGPLSRRSRSSSGRRAAAGLPCQAKFALLTPVRDRFSFAERERSGGVACGGGNSSARAPTANGASWKRRSAEKPGNGLLTAPRGCARRQS